MLFRTNIAAARCMILYRGLILGFILGLTLVLPAAASAQNPIPLDDSAGREIAARLERYYQWVLASASTVLKSEPRVVDVPGTNRFSLDRSTEQQFIDGFMDSGNFSAEFPAAVSRYYAKYQKEFAGYAQAEFDQMAHDGRGPLMEVEDMDIFFCAQEYEYKDEYIKNIRLKDLEISGDTASVVTIFPFEWETHFKFNKVDGLWLISAFCVYE